MIKLIDIFNEIKVNQPGVKAAKYPYEAESEVIKLYDNISSNFLRPLIYEIAKKLDISPKDFYTSFSLYDKPSLTVQVKLNNDGWKEPWAGNSRIMNTQSGEGFVITTGFMSGIKMEHDEESEDETPLFELYNKIKKEKILTLVRERVNNFASKFKDKELIAPNTPVLYMEKQ